MAKIDFGLLLTTSGSEHNGKIASLANAIKVKFMSLDN